MVSESTEFILGSGVSCRDGPCGELTRIIVAPGPRTVTHLVVKPPQRGQAARLVPVRLAGAGADATHLRCSTSQFKGLQEAEQTQIVPGALGDLDDGQAHRLSAPYYGPGGLGLAMAIGTGLGSGTAPCVSPLITSRPARWNCAPESTCTPRTAPSGRFRG